MNVLQDGMKWLAGQLKASVSLKAYFVRGTQFLHLDVTLGHQLLRTSDNKGNVKTERTDRDFIVTATDLSFDQGVTLTKPQRGDYWLLDLSDGFGLGRYDLTSYVPGEAPWRHSDAFRTIIRMHTKFTGTGILPPFPIAVPDNGIFAEDGVTYIMAEDGTTFLVQE